jgi:hypothetical protein
LFQKTDSGHCEERERRACTPEYLSSYGVGIVFRHAGVAIS